ncbi:MAG: excinuclease ABC subunit UvrB [Candidatus Saccharibacteria bacterium]|nr:excinuclease ABC subunit UvrB [Candidatus Saccharibacteria bacterium]
MPKFQLVSKYQPTGDQPQAIAQLSDGLKKGIREQTLLGVTGSGKTFTMANIIQNYQRPTLVLAHNKTLAAQLYSEFREFFPKNEVHYFVSYFDYYQPEAYIASSDTYIEKDSAINDEIDRLRHGATEALLTREDVIIIASVSCIYGIGSPANYTKMSMLLVKGEDGWFTPSEGQNPLAQSVFTRTLVNMQYHRNDLAFERGNFRVMGDTVDLFPASGEHAYRFEFGFDQLEEVKIIDPLTAEVHGKPDRLHIFPNTHYATPKDQLERALVTIREEFDKRLAFFERHHKFLEAQRLSQRTKYDLEMLESTGFVKGIENYSRHLDGRKPGEPPATLLDFFPEDFLLLVDESHMTLPQVRGMYNGDHARKETLVEYGFRLPSALDNRPLQWNEFMKHINHAIYVSATPADYELSHSPEPAQQVIRPTGLLDPEIEVRSSEGQIDDLMEEIDRRIAKNQRVLVTTLTKRMAEDLSEHLKTRGVKTAYIHSDIDTLERGDILRDLRAGVYDVLVGINLLREGLDLPEVSLVAILDADKEGFLRSEPALIQTIGRAARHVEGKVIMYGDHITESMHKAIEETMRRREIQQKYNEEHHITPRGIQKEVGAGLRAIIPEKEKESKLDLKKVPPEEIPNLIKHLKSEMQLAAANLEFERAAALRDLIRQVEEDKK